MGNKSSEKKSFPSEVSSPMKTRTREKKTSESEATSSKTRSGSQRLAGIKEDTEEAISKSLEDVSISTRSTRNKKSKESDIAASDKVDKVMVKDDDSKCETTNSENYASESSTEKQPKTVMKKAMKAKKSER